MRIIWTKAASLDLESIEEYIRQDDPIAAIKQVHRVMDAIQYSLAEAPLIGRIGRMPGTREFYIKGTPYIVAYRLEEDVLVVLRVIHGARIWPKKI